MTYHEAVRAVRASQEASPSLADALLPLNEANAILAFYYLKAVDEDRILPEKDD